MCQRFSDTRDYGTDSGYGDSRRPSVSEMEDIARILRSDPNKNEIGFVANKKKGRRSHDRRPDYRLPTID